MDRRIKNIIFDFGGIIVDLDKQAAVRAFDEIGFDTASYIRDYVQEGIFASLESGDISPEFFYDYVRSKAGRHIEDSVISQAWNRMLVAISPSRLQFICHLRTKFRVFMLSNTNVIHWNYSCSELASSIGYRMEDCFDGIFLSYRMHLTKPDVRLFHAVQTEASLLAEETLFIDDSVENCKVAESIGFQVFHSRCPEDWFTLF
ncbi:HAD family phosphatase [Bacteroides acidifaciens]|uniref:HAD family hydrolase n=2 Tax=Bacteroides acidifaciens TaxID=85831 RepID=UPI0030139709